MEKTMTKKLLNESLIESIRNNDISLCEKFISDGANIKIYKNKCLIEAVGLGHIKIVKLLIEHGANAKARNSKAMIIAFEKEYLDIARYLVENTDIKENINHHELRVFNNCLETERLLFLLGKEYDIYTIKSYLKECKFDRIELLESLGAITLPNNIISLLIPYGHTRGNIYLPHMEESPNIETFKYLLNRKFEISISSVMKIKKLEKLHKWYKGHYEEKVESDIITSKNGFERYNGDIKSWEEYHKQYGDKSIFWLNNGYINKDTVNIITDNYTGVNFTDSEIDIYEENYKNMRNYVYNEENEEKFNKKDFNFRILEMVQFQNEKNSLLKKIKKSMLKIDLV